MNKIHYKTPLRNCAKTLNAIRQNEHQIMNLKALFFYITIKDILLSLYYFNLVRVVLVQYSVIINESRRDYNNFWNEKCFTEKEWLTK